MIILNAPKSCQKPPAPKNDRRIPSNDIAHHPTFPAKKKLPTIKKTPQSFKITKHIQNIFWDWRIKYFFEILKMKFCRNFTNIFRKCQNLRRIAENSEKIAKIWSKSRNRWDYSIVEMNYSVVSLLVDGPEVPPGVELAPRRARRRRSSRRRRRAAGPAGARRVPSRDTTE